MKKLYISIIAIVALLAIYCILSYNQLVNSQEAVNQQWAQVQTVYQRRLDLIPNLVATVKGYAKHEKSTLIGVTQARAAATQVKLDASHLNPQQMAQYIKAQQKVSSSLGRLLVTVERYPNLKANQNFLALQDELEGTENRISVERHRYNNVAKQYDVAIRRFPRVIFAKMFNFTAKPYFTADKQAAHAPKVTF